jgi:tRNA pseudouridine38-40 synthase
VIDGAPATAATPAAAAVVAKNAPRRKWDANGGGASANAKRQRGAAFAGTTGPAKSTEGEDAADGSGGLLGRKRKVALAVMYRGSAYCGLQLQNGAGQAGQPTVERELMDAVYAAGGISKENMNDTQKIKWQRAARTDKGVHAAGNILSLMMICDGPPPATCHSQSTDIVERINAHLPEDIRVIAAPRVLGGFHAKYDCTSRVYEYILPSFVFDEHPLTVELMHEAAAVPGVEADEMSTKATAAANAATSEAPFAYPSRLLEYRLTAEKTASLASKARSTIRTSRVRRVDS